MTDTSPKPGAGGGKPKGLSFLLAGGFALALLGVGMIVRGELQEVLKPPPSLQGVVLGKPKRLGGLPTLKDHFGQPFNTKSLQQDAWTLIFFGYAHCPDVCPTALSQLGEAFQIMAKRAPKHYKRTRGVFVSVDPDRDKAEDLKEFVSYFHPDFLGVTGTKTGVLRFSQAFGAYYQIDKSQDPVNYQVNHISSFFVVSPEGELRALLQPRLYSPEQLADKIIQIQKQLDG